jgi:uncharacterized membrane protein
MNTSPFPVRIRPALAQSPHARQRGSIMINTAIALSLIVVLLIGTELGYLFYMKREFQKTADLAALAGAMQLDPLAADGACSAAQGAAVSNASVNLPGITVEMPECGHWASTNTALSNDACFPETADHFVPGQLNYNAIRVRIKQAPPALLALFPGDRTICVQAVAALDAPFATFSVGSRLLRLDGDSTLGAMLKAIGLNLDNTIVAGYDGLATVPITPGGLLCAIQGVNLCPDASITVGSLNELLDADITLGQLLDAAVSAGGRSDLVNANLALVNALKIKLDVDDLVVKLGSLSGTSGLFATITAPDGSSALNARIDALDLIQAAIGVASAGHAVDIPGLNISLLGLAKVTAKAGVVEAPSIAIGSKGITAYTAQVRTFIHVRTDDTLLGSLLAPLVKLNLPIVLDLVTAQGTLEDLCTPALRTATGEERALINVQGSILKACVGKISNASGTQDCSVAANAAAYQACFDQLLFSKKQACDASLDDMELINVLGLLKTTNHLNLNTLAIEQPASVTLAEGGTDTVGNSLAIGDTISNLVAQISNLLFAGTASGGQPSSTNLASLAEQLWNDSGKSVPDGGAGCTADTTACRAQRLSNAKSFIQQSSEQSGLLNGLLNGIGDLLGIVGGVLGGDGCSYTGLFGSTSNAGCVNLIETTLGKSSSASSNGVTSTVSNALTVLTGLLRPVLNALGDSVLTPLLQDILGVHLGEVDVKLHSLQCSSSKLVY